MTDDELAAIEARASAATEGPWSVDTSIVTWIMADRLHVATIPRAFDGDFSPANAAFIAHARTDIPTLLAAYRAKEAECARMRERLEWICLADTVDEAEGIARAALEAKP